MSGLSEHRLESGAEFDLSATQDLMSFSLRNKAEGMIAKLLGDDAARFRQDYDEMKINFPAWDADKLLAQLWDQGGYGWLAQQEE
ncbi:MAG: hypothetical protein WB816_17795 [Methylocystis sp.]